MCRTKVPGHAGRPGSVGSRGAASRRRSSGEGLRARPVTFRAERHRPSPRSGGPASGTTIPRSHRPLRRRCGPPTRHSGRCSRFGTRPRGPAPTTGICTDLPWRPIGVFRSPFPTGKVHATDPSEPCPELRRNTQPSHRLSTDCPQVVPGERARPRPPGTPRARSKGRPVAGLGAVDTPVDTAVEIAPSLWTTGRFCGRGPQGRDRWRRDRWGRGRETPSCARLHRQPFSSGGRGRRPRATTRRAGRSGSSSSSGPRS
jgi:hypothetical protein